jgi:hypothetical protein
MPIRLVKATRQARRIARIEVLRPASGIRLQPQVMGGREATSWTLLKRCCKI